MNKTKIEWVKNPDGTQGYTWNPITGCLNGCPYCYARKLANGRLRSRYLANMHIAPVDITPLGRVITDDGVKLRVLTDPFYPRFWPDRLYVDMGKKPKGIFVCDMSDLFGIGIPEMWTRQILNASKIYPEHRFYLLTKQPHNLIKFSPFPDNCWVGVTVTTNNMYQEAVDWLEQVQAKLRYISFEPLLGRVALDHPAWEFKADTVNWVIIGAQTKPYKPPRIEWVEEISEAATKAGIPIFLKNNLLPLYNSLREAKSPQSLPFKEGHLRQEMPR